MWLLPGFRLEGLGLKLAVLLEENFDFALGFLQFLAAGSGKLDTLLEQGESLLQGNVALFQFVYDLFQPLQALFKIRQDFSLSAKFYCDFLVGCGEMAVEKKKGNSFMNLSSKFDVNC